MTGKQENDTKKPKLFQRLGWTGILMLVALAGWATTFGYHSFDNYSHENAEFCGTCHNMEYHVNSYTDSNHLDNVHAQAGVECQDCHTDYTLTEKIKSGWQYVIGDYDRLPSKRKFTDEMCLECHISMEYQADKSDFLPKNPHLSHWPDLRCGSCHLSHEEQIDYCSRCHENGGQEMTGKEYEPRSYNPWSDPDAERPDVSNP